MRNENERMILSLKWVSWAAAVLLLGLRVLGARAEDAVQPPMVGRPANFNGAMGSFEVSMRAQPHELNAEDPLVLTVRISGTGSLETVRRPDLRQLPRFTRGFQIDNLGERDIRAEKAREFDYRLRPRNTGVKQIPPLPFVCFKPGMVPEHLGYQTTYAPAIPIVVQPRLAVRPSAVQTSTTPGGYPDSVYQIAEDAQLLGRQTQVEICPPWLTIVGLALPPILSLSWWLLWKRRHPDAARLATQRQSRAARQAQRALHMLEKLPADEQPPRAREILQEYLLRRLNLTIADPTPEEIGLHLDRTGTARDRSREAVAFFAACDMARFAPGMLEGRNGWAEQASKLLSRWEEEQWATS